jgi:ParB family chromosome partitioning protein
MTTKEKLTPRRGALGKGISSLLGDPDDDAAPAAETPIAPTRGASSTSGSVSTTVVAPTPSSTSRGPVEAEVLRLPIEVVDPNPQQPRKIFDDEALKELAASLRQDGVLQPIIVTHGDAPGRYIIVAGERRWRASKLAGLTSIPAIVREGANADILRLALIENIQRSDLNIIEEAEAYASLIKDYGLTQEQCADRVGKERSTVANILRLLGLPREIQDDIMDGRLTMGHGRAILSLDDKKLMLRCRDMVIKKGLTVRQTEQLCKSFKDPKGGADKRGGAIKDDADLQYINESLRAYLHTKVRLAGTTGRGRIEISYFSAAELERILKLIGYKF